MHIHKMRLVTEAFNNIKKGIKKVEIRLNDEKRQLIKIGDEIIFEELSKNPRVIRVKVLDLIHADSFSNLLNLFEDISIFYNEDISNEDLLKLCYTFYTEKEESTYGVLGIKIELVV